MFVPGSKQKPALPSTAARGAGRRSVNAVMPATYWEIGRRIIQAEQGGARRAGYGEALLERLAAEYRTTLPDADQLADELTRTRQQLERARTGRR